MLTHWSYIFLALTHRHDPIPYLLYVFLALTHRHDPIPYLLYVFLALTHCHDPIPYLLYVFLALTHRHDPIPYLLYVFLALTHRHDPIPYLLYVFLALTHHHDPIPYLLYVFLALTHHYDPIPYLLYHPLQQVSCLFLPNMFGHNVEYVIVTCLDRQLRDPLGVVNDQLQQVQVLESYALQVITKINFSQNKFNGIFNEYHSETRVTLRLSPIRKWPMNSHSNWKNCLSHYTIGSQGTKFSKTSVNYSHFSLAEPIPRMIIVFVLVRVRTEMT